MNSLTFGLLFFIPGVAFFLLILFKYTEQEHQKELKKYAWFREDKRKWLWDSDFALFTKIAEKSFIITKIIMLLLSLYMVAAGVLGLCMYFF
ncbi:hypothetical protein AWM68_13545 [Fictibacillus phosphorivorans]|uniref:DUF3899 domain-containing protein n=1 Tax=Fictibacillus phosphorivorans TaxID=1221500 RepID=A0A163PTW6_9BACL|nr:hypothetical protein [Fictibacillus phosphorivorans]KZE64125.1 hypothetical protein AWM68_13545 [Fictibacillus phosphorivorans]